MKKHLYTFMSVLLALFTQTALSAQNALEITAPANVAGTYFTSVAFFSGPFNNEAGELSMTDDGSGTNTACNPISTDLTNKIALIDRGGCGFSTKAINAQNAGAIAVVICNNQAGNPFMMLTGAPSGVTIPVLSLDSTNCASIKAAMPGVSGSMVGPAANETCISASTITDGTTTQAALATGYGTVFGGATHGAWYKYSVASDCALNVQSCNGGADTRLIIIPGDDCEAASINILGGAFASNSDACADGAGGMGASSLDILATAGSNWYIHWDDAEGGDGFDFEVLCNPLPQVDVTMTVDMIKEAVDPSGVFIVGNFNNWIPTLMTDNGNGSWSYTTSATSLDTVLWNYQNGSGNTEPTAELSSCGMSDGMGGINRMVVVNTLNDVLLGAVCYGSCAGCVPTDCKEPIFIVDDDLESYTGGVAAADQSTHWAPWPGGAASLVTDTFSLSGNNSLLVDGTPGDQDNLLLLGDKTSGHYKISFSGYAAEGMGWYFNIQKDQNNPGQEYAMQLDFQPDGIAVLDAGADDTLSFSWEADRWMGVNIYIDLDNDNIRLYVDDQFIFAWPYHWTTFDQDGIIQLGSVNFFPVDENYIFYIDNVVYAAIPPVGDGQYCTTATPIQPGTHTIDGPIECYGGAFYILDISSDDIDNNGEAAAWYSYTPTEDGVITVSSCGEGTDTRVWVFANDCMTLETVVVNDDRCPIGSSGSEWASEVQVVVAANTTYYIMWDNQWEEEGFDWTLEFSTDAPEPGNFCASAVDVQPGFHHVDIIDGLASVAGPIVGAFGPGVVVNPTSYVGSEWFQFTPTEDGLMTISTCDMTGEDTRIWLYDGTCTTFKTLNLLAVSDDDCGATGVNSIIEDFPARAGTTYYIEFDNGLTDGDFDWMLDFFQTRQVTFTVNMENETVDIANGGVLITGTFTDFEEEGMTNNFDGTWSYEATLRQGDEVQYRFLNGTGNQEPDDELEDCGVENVFGGFNRVYTVGAMDEVLPTVCYGFCVDCDMVDVDEIAFKAGLQIYPNPAQQHTQLVYSFDETIDLTIALYNLTGQQLYYHQLEGVQNGQHLIDVQNLASGLYIVKITNGQHQLSNRLLVAPR